MIKINDTYLSSSGTSYIDSGNYHMFTFTFKEGDHLRLYIDGEFVKEDITDVPILPTSTHSVDIGGVGHGGWEDLYMLNGSIDEVMIFNRSLSAEEINKIYVGISEKLVVDSSDTATGDVWKLGIKAVDNSSISSETNSSSLSITSGLVISSVVLNSTNPLTNSTNQDLTGYVDASNSEMSNVTEIYNWYKNDTLNRTTFIEDGLVAYFPLDYDANDYSSTNDGTLQDNATVNFSNGQKSGSLQLDGDDDYINVPHDSSLVLEDNLTLVAWIKLNELGEEQIILSKHYVFNTFFLKVHSDNYIDFYQGDDTGGSNYDGANWDEDYTLAIDTWAQIAVVRTGKRDVELFINGVSKGTDTLNYDPVDDGYPVQVGIQEGGAREFNGSIDEVMIFNRSLSAEEINKLYSGVYGKLIVDSLDTSIGDVWKLGARIGDSTSISSETNSSSLSVTQGPILNLDYPFEEIVVQKNQSGVGELRIFGNVSGMSIDSFNVTYQGNDSGVQVVDVDGGGDFNDTIYLSSGAYNLSFDSGDGNLGVIDEVGVGDVIVVSGQSNSVETMGDTITAYTAPNWVWQSYTNTNTPTSWTNYTWVSMTNARRWSELAYYAADIGNQPIMIINIGVGGAPITYLKQGGTYYNYGIERINYFTGGTMDVKGVIYNQGETDIANLMTTETYLSHLQNMTEGLLLDLNVLSKKVVICQTLKSSSDTISPMEVREAQQRSWTEISNVSRGAILYDIYLGAGEVHPSGDAKSEYQRRLSLAGIEHFYSNSTYTPSEISSVQKINSTSIRINYTLPVVISNWSFDSNEKAYGFILYSDSNNITDDNVSTTTISSDNLSMVIVLDTDITDYSNISICTNFTCYGQPIVRTLDNNLSVPILYSSEIIDVPVTPTITPSSDSPTSSGGTPTYNPTESNIQQGYSKQLGKSWKLKFTSNEEEHQLKLDSFNPTNKTATITISSKPQTKTLSVGEEWKVNLDGDDNYDLLVRLENVTTIRANVFIMEIDEEIPSKIIDAEKPTVQEVVVEDKPETNWFLFIGYIILVIVLLGGAFIIGKKWLGKK